MATALPSAAGAKKYSKAAQKTWLNGPKGLPAAALVRALDGSARAGNGQYEERQGQTEHANLFFEKVGGGAFIYRRGIRWCLGPELDGEEVIWAEVQRALARLPACRNYPLRAASGRPEISIVRSSLKIERASGLKSGDLDGRSDPYIVCKIPGKPQLGFQTATLFKCLNPIWREQHEIDGVELGDILQFKVMDWDKGGVENHDLIGSGKMQVMPGGFDGELVLTLRGRTAGSLKVELTLPQVVAPKEKKKDVSFDSSHPRAVVDALSYGGEDASRAVVALSSVVTTDDLRSRFVAAGAVQRLVPMLAEGSAESRLKVATALSNLGKCKVCQAVIINTGGVQLLLKLFFSAQLRGKEEALQALLRFGDLASVQSEIVDAGAIPHLVALLSCGSTAGASRAAQLLALLSTEADVAAYVVRSNALPRLVQLLRAERAEGEEAQVQAASALASVANTNAHRKDVLDAGALEPLIKLLKSGSPEGKAKSAAAFAALSTPDNVHHAWTEPAVNSDVLADAGVVQLLLGLLSHPEEICVEQAALAICQMARGRGAGVIMLESGVPALLKLLKAGNDTDRCLWASATFRALAKSQGQSSLEAAVPDEDKRLIRGVLGQDQSEANLPLFSPLQKSCSSPLLRARTPQVAPLALVANPRAKQKSLPRLHETLPATLSRDRSAPGLSLGVDLRFVKTGSLAETLAVPLVGTA